MKVQILLIFYLTVYYNHLKLKYSKNKLGLNGLGYISKGRCIETHRNTEQAHITARPLPVAAYKDSMVQFDMSNNRKYIVECIHFPTEVLNLFA